MTNPRAAKANGVDVKSWKSIWSLMVDCSIFAFVTWHGELSRIKKKKNQKTVNKNLRNRISDKNGLQVQFSNERILVSNKIADTLLGTPEQ
jgi:DNA primase large subunit